MLQKDELFVNLAEIYDNSTLKVSQQHSVGFRFVEKFSTVTYKCRIITDCHVYFHMLFAILKKTRDEKGPGGLAGPGTHVSRVVTAACPRSVTSRRQAYPQQTVCTGNSSAQRAEVRNTHNSVTEGGGAFTGLCILPNSC